MPTYTRHLANSTRLFKSRPFAWRPFSSSAGRRAEEVRIVEVGPRDGLQNEKKTISLVTKFELIRRLAKTGLKDIEAGSFVAPKWVPQMANSADVLNYILGHPPPAIQHIKYNFLVPNLKGFDNFVKTLDAAYSANLPKQSAAPTSPSEQEKESPASTTSTQDPNEMPSSTTEETPQEPLEKQDQYDPASNTSTQDPNEMPSKTIPHSGKIPGARRSYSTAAAPSPFSTEISIFAAATDSFSRANTNCTVAESLERFKPIITAAKARNVRVRGYVSVALGCPFDGLDVPPQQVADVTASLLSMGVDEVSVADTTGMGTAPRTENLMKALSAAGIQARDLALHFHDTYGMALVNMVVGLEHGVRVFDSSVAGLGGCPYAKGATGNVATEDLVYALHSLGMHTGVDLKTMAETGEWISREIGRNNEARAGKAVLARLSAQQ